MGTEYPDEYYAQLAKLIVKNTSLSLKPAEVCFYQGEAHSYKKTTIEKKSKPKKKTSFILTPWAMGFKRQSNVEVTKETHTDYYAGTLYITNIRIVFDCKVDHFDLLIPSIKSVQPHLDGIRVVSGRSSYDLITYDVEQICKIIDLMNKAQTEPASPCQSAESSSKPSITSRNDSYAVAAFVHYCDHGGKPVGKSSNDYPSYFKYDYNVNDPIKYHKKVIDEGFLTEAPIEQTLKTLKVAELKQILISHGLLEKGKKDDLIQRISENINCSDLGLEKIYVPTEKGRKHLSEYEYLFRIKKYSISTKEFEATKARMVGSKTNDIIWKILGNRFNEYNTGCLFGLARNELLYMAYLLSEEEYYSDALYHYVLVLYYDMSGCSNGKDICPKEDLFLAPAILQNIYELKEYFADDMVERCFSRYPLPHHYFSIGKFGVLLDMIFEDETIEINSLI